MKKVIVIGCPGSGKSVFSRALRDVTDLPLYHLDSIYWREGRTFISREELIERINEIGATDSWIIDGNYFGTMELRMSLCDTIIFLDYPTEVCLEGIKARCGFARPDMPWVEPSDKPDEDFAEKVRSYNAVNRPKVLERISKYSDRNVIVFRSRQEADDFLKTLRENIYNE